jgi:AP endonuclease-2
VIINVYCPRVDKDKPERLTYKLNFYAALEKRARFFLERGSYVTEI